MLSKRFLLVSTHALPLVLRSFSSKSPVTNETIHMKVHGIPLCMPSVAATYMGHVVVGVIYDCHRNEMFTAVRGRGAYLDGKPIAVGAEKDLGDATIAMGSPPYVCLKRDV